ncbi:hypothetical protein KO495_10995 [Colwellia sp. D2M02]|uniref:hypothetical protein n=1 Tax=Colwellia sp. D2M02 TaxID=2841562 RepID=UPI001C081DD8|nr:hypothetical protein [Colwellia sp. D2M02]MBU2893849.1 hypothetical protein [Colwellia sp. D2M02]
MKKTIVLALTLSTTVMTSSAFAKTTPCNTVMAPAQVAHSQFNLHIDASQSTFAPGFASKGLKIHAFAEQGKLNISGSGGNDHVNSDGLYSYHRLSNTHAIEQSVSFEKGAYTVDYYFDDEDSGVFRQVYSGGQTVIQGDFSVENKQTELLAPESLAGYTVALRIKHTESVLPGGYPKDAVVIQRYDVDTMTGRGFGKDTVNFTGNYQFNRTSKTTAVEQNLQITENFSLPYIMTYQFETKNSGTWSQNFADGLIIFSGSFDLFASE